MPRAINKLSATFVRAAKEQGRFSDGGGLYLQVTGQGTKSWLFRFTLAGRSREMGLGPLADVSLAEARDAAKECRISLRDGFDPIEKRQSERAARLLAQSSKRTFKECAQSYYDTHFQSGRRSKYKDQWLNSVTNYAYPEIGKMAVSDISTDQVMKVIEPIWHRIPETAGKLRAKIEKILDWATVRGYRVGDNPARWKGHISELLPAYKSLIKVKHMPAMPHADVAAFIRKLDGEDAPSAKALKFTILTAARSGEVRLATWDEIDLEAKTWTIPDERMKGGREHVVPLTPVAVTLLEGLPRLKTSKFLFNGVRSGRAISDMTMTQLLRRMEYKGITVHGFRSSFRDWAAECTNYPRDIIEKCLAHRLKDKVEAAYHRSNLLDKRRPLMDAWAEYCHLDQEAYSSLVPFARTQKAT